MRNRILLGVAVLALVAAVAWGDRITSPDRLSLDGWRTWVALRVAATVGAAVLAVVAACAVLPRARRSRWVPLGVLAGLAACWGAASDLFQGPVVVRGSLVELDKRREVAAGRGAVAGVVHVTLTVLPAGTAQPVKLEVSGRHAARVLGVAAECAGRELQVAKLRELGAVIDARCF